jgi:hypothetical protein
MSELDALLRSVVARLADVPDEALGELRRTRFRGRRMTPSGRAWRLGVLLVDRDGRLYETGEITRAIEPPRSTATKSESAETRRELRHIAARGGFAHGEVVNFGYTPLDLSALPAGPLSEVDGVVMVRWTGTFVIPLAQYLEDRLELLHDS